ncbi:MAG: hypothetical protein HC802_13740 [Caldilineaceae bacterium]|nr:hypothetical protein [Caldilineaceae bacterium]
MLKSVEAMTDQNGVLRILDSVELPRLRRVIITILDDEPDEEMMNLALLSEPALSVDWQRPEEDEAWSHLSQLPSL